MREGQGIGLPGRAAEEAGGDLLLVVSSLLNEGRVG